MTFRCPSSLLEKLDAAQAEFRKRDRTETITELLQMALLILERKPTLEEHESIKYLRNNLYNTQLVDWVAELDQDRLEALYGVLSDERRIRFNTKMGKF